MIEESIRGLKEDEIPALRDEIRELREALEGGRGEDHTPWLGGGWSRTPAKEDGGAKRVPRPTL